MKRLLEKLFPSLGKKIAVAVILVSLVAGTTFVFFAHRTGYSMLEQQSHEKARSMAILLKGIIEHIMLEGKPEHLGEALASATTSADIIDVYVLRPDGSVAVGAKSGDSFGRFALDKFENLPGSDGEKVYATREHDSTYEYIITPVVKKPACLRCHNNGNPLAGFVAMKFGMDDVRSAARQHRTVNILMTVLTFGGLGAIMFFALSILVIKPIGRLHSHIRRIEGGVGKIETGEPTQFPLLPESSGKDEIAELCKDFNTLVQRLNDANEKLLELHGAQLEHADRLASTGQIAAGIAHEIKNPIAGVLGALQVFDGEMAEEDPRKEIVAEMMTQLERVNHAVNDLLSYARPAPPVFEELDVNDSIQKTVALLSQQTKGKQICLETDLTDEQVTISADRKQVQQVLWNILLNAIQAVESSGTVSVSSRRENSSVKIMIGDTGQGISKEQIASVFKPFFTTKHKGTGLGMTISKRIVEQHNGTIAIESEIGKGTEVTIILPQHQQE